MLSLFDSDESGRETVCQTIGFHRVIIAAYA